MTIFHYAVIEKPESDHSVSGLHAIDMENVDYKRQPDLDSLKAQIAHYHGLACGVIRGGMFGLATNQVWAFTAWEDSSNADRCIRSIDDTTDYRIRDHGKLAATVRPQTAEIIDRPGIYVIRWIRMRSSDIDEYTQLCLETWPGFEAMAKTRCYGVFRPLEKQDTSTILMLTWYATLDDWEKSRRLDPADTEKWARRSEMELAHWAEAGRLAC